MEIQRVILNNVGRFEHLDIPLAPTEPNPSNITIFVGNNGAGKTSVVKALATSLSLFTARLRTEKGSGKPIPEEAILNTAHAASIEIEIGDASNHHFKWIRTYALTLLLGCESAKRNAPIRYIWSRCVSPMDSSKK